MDRGVNIVAPDFKKKVIRLICRHFCKRIITHESAIWYRCLLRNEALTFTFGVRLPLIPIEACRLNI